MYFSLFSSLEYFPTLHFDLTLFKACFITKLYVNVGYIHLEIIEEWFRKNYNLSKSHRKKQLTFFCNLELCLHYFEMKINTFFRLTKIFMGHNNHCLHIIYKTRVFIILLEYFYGRTNKKSKTKSTNFRQTKLTTR